MTDTDSVDDEVIDTPSKRTKKVSPFESLMNRPPSTLDVTMTIDPNDAEEADRLRKASVLAASSASRYPTDTDRAVVAVEAKDELHTFLGSVETVTFTFESRGQDELEELQTAWPPSELALAKHRADVGNPKATLDWDPDDFPPRLFAFCCSGAEFSDGRSMNGFSEEEAVELYDTWPNADVDELIAASFKINKRTSKIEPLGND